MSKYTTIQQHQPLRIPSGWGTQEKRFVAQLEELLDDLYRRFNRLKMSDLGGDLQNIIKGDHASIEVLDETITLVAGESAQIGKVTLTQNGVTINGGTIAMTGGNITLTGGEIHLTSGDSSVDITGDGVALSGASLSMNATSSMSVASTGSVDINGSSGSIVMGTGSSVNAVKGIFTNLTLNGNNVVPIVYSKSKPKTHKVIWAQPHYTTTSAFEDVYKLIPTMSRSASHSFHMYVGILTSPLHYEFGYYDTTTTQTSFLYTITIPLENYSSSSITKTYYCALGRGNKVITFSGKSKTIAAKKSSDIVFTLTSTTDLVNGGDDNITLDVWADPSNERIYIMHGDAIEVNIQGGASSTLKDDEVTMHYIP